MQKVYVGERFYGPRMTARWFKDFLEIKSQRT